MFSFHSDAAGCPVKLVKAPDRQGLDQKPSVRTAAAKRKLGADAPMILAEKQLPGKGSWLSHSNTGGLCFNSHTRFLSVAVLARIHHENKTATAFTGHWLS